MKLWVRIVAAVLVPCLIADPMSASAVTEARSIRYTYTPHTYLFQQEALAVAAVTGCVLLTTPFRSLGWLLRYSKTKWNSTKSWSDSYAVAHPYWARLVFAVWLAKDSPGILLFIRLYSQGYRGAALWGSLGWGIQNLAFGLPGLLLWIRFEWKLFDYRRSRDLLARASAGSEHADENRSYPIPRSLKGLLLPLALAGSLAYGIAVVSGQELEKPSFAGAFNISEGLVTKMQLTVYYPQVDFNYQLDVVGKTLTISRTPKTQSDPDRWIKTIEASTDKMDYDIALDSLESLLVAAQQSKLDDPVFAQLEDMYGRMIAMMQPAHSHLPYAAAPLPPTLPAWSLGRNLFALAMIPADGYSNMLSIDRSLRNNVFSLEFGSNGSVRAGGKTEGFGHESERLEITWEQEDQRVTQANFNSALTVNASTAPSEYYRILRLMRDYAIRGLDHAVNDSKEHFEYLINELDKEISNDPKPEVSTLGKFAFWLPVALAAGWLLDQVLPGNHAVRLTAALPLLIGVPTMLWRAGSKYFKEDLAKHLREQGNSESTIKKTLSFFEGRSRYSEHILEVGAGRAEAAYAIALRNPRTRVIASDVYGDESYLSYRDAWRKGTLTAQMTPLENLVVLRTGTDLFKWLPDFSIDGVLLVNATIAAEYDLAALFTEHRIESKLRPGADVVVKPYAKTSKWASDKPIDGFPEDVLFKKLDTTFRGIDFRRINDYPYGAEEAFVWQATPGARPLRTRLSQFVTRYEIKTIWRRTSADPTVKCSVLGLLTALDLSAGPLMAIGIAIAAVTSYFLYKYFNSPYRALVRHIGIKRNGLSRLPPSINALAFWFGNEPLRSIAERVGWENAYPVLMGLSLVMNSQATEEDLYKEAFILRGVKLLYLFLTEFKGIEPERADLICLRAQEAVQNAGFSKTEPSVSEESQNSLLLIAGLNRLGGSFGKADEDAAALQRYEAQFDQPLAATQNHSPSNEFNRREVIRTGLLAWLGGVTELQVPQTLINITSEMADKAARQKALESIREAVLGGFDRYLLGHYHPQTDDNFLTERVSNNATALVTIGPKEALSNLIAGRTRDWADTLERHFGLINLRPFKLASYAKPAAAPGRSDNMAFANRAGQHYKDILAQPPLVDDERIDVLLWPVREGEPIYVETQRTLAVLGRELRQALSEGRIDQSVFQPRADHDDAALLLDFLDMLSDPEHGRMNMQHYFGSVLWVEELAEATQDSTAKAATLKTIAFYRALVQGWSKSKLPAENATTAAAPARPLGNIGKLALWLPLPLASGWLLGQLPAIPGAHLSAGVPSLLMLAAVLGKLFSDQGQDPGSPTPSAAPGANREAIRAHAEAAAHDLMVTPMDLGTYRRWLMSAEELLASIKLWESRNFLGDRILKVIFAGQNTYPEITTRLESMIPNYGQPPDEFPPAIPGSLQARAEAESRQIRIAHTIEEHRRLWLRTFLMALNVSPLTAEMLNRTTLTLDDTYLAQTLVERGTEQTLAQLETLLAQVPPKIHKQEESYLPPRMRAFQKPSYFWVEAENPDFVRISRIVHDLKTRLRSAAAPDETPGPLATLSRPNISSGVLTPSAFKLLMAYCDTIFSNVIQVRIRFIQRQVSDMTIPALAKKGIDLLITTGKSSIYDVLSQRMELSQDRVNDYFESGLLSDEKWLDQYERSLWIWEVFSELSRRAEFDEEISLGAIDRWLAKLAAAPNSKTHGNDPGLAWDAKSHQDIFFSTLLGSLILIVAGRMFLWPRFMSSYSPKATAAIIVLLVLDAVGSLMLIHVANDSHRATDIEVHTPTGGPSIWRRVDDQSLLTPEQVLGLLYGSITTVANARQVLMTAVRIAYEELEHAKGRGQLTAKFIAMVRGAIWWARHYSLNPMAYRQAVLELINRTVVPSTLLPSSQNIQEPAPAPFSGVIVPLLIFGTSNLFGLASGLVLRYLTSNSILIPTLSLVLVATSLLILFFRLQIHKFAKQAGFEVYTHDRVVISLSLALTGLATGISFSLRLWGLLQVGMQIPTGALDEMLFSAFLPMVPKPASDAPSDFPAVTPRALKNAA